MEKNRGDFKGLNSIFEEVEREISQEDIDTTIESFENVDLFEERRYQPNIEKFNFSAAEERAVVGKYDKHLLPFLCFIYFMACMEKNNIGNANAAGMSTDLGLSDSHYADLLTSYYIAYIVMQWTIFLWKLLNPRIYIPIAIVCWGVVATTMTKANTFPVLFVQRFLLGGFQAFYSPGIYYYLSFFYFRQEQARRNAIFMSFLPLAAAMSGLIAFLITKFPPKNFTPWRLIFLVDGLPGILGGLIGFYAIAESPVNAHFLTARQKKIAVARTIRQVGKADRGGKKIAFAELGWSFLDLKIWLPTLISLCHNVASSSLPIFMPVIIQGFGYTEQMSQAFTVPPYIISIIFMLGVCFISDKFARRGVFVVGFNYLAATGYIILATVHHMPSVRYLAVFLASIGIYTSHCVNITWTGDNQGSDSKKGLSYVFLHVIGELGVIIGTRLFPHAQGPYYIKGSWICAGLLILSGTFALFYRVYLASQNRKLDEKYGVIGDCEDTIHIADDTNHKYRYIL